MGILETSVSQYSLTVDASETIRAMVDSADNAWGRRLHDALTQATFGTDAVFAIAPYMRVDQADFDPRASEASDLPEVSGQSVDRVLANLEAASLITTRTVLHEASSETYLSEGRIVTAVQVHRPFVLVTVRYSWSPAAEYPSRCQGSVYADQWQVTDRSYIVPAGCYLVGEVGEYCYDLAGVAGMASESDETVCWLFELEGFGASHCCAECDSCGSRWSAESGSWRFDADYCDADPWHFDDAENFDDKTDTIACPQCGLGRVGFLIS